MMNPDAAPWYPPGHPANAGPGAPAAVQAPAHAAPVAPAAPPAPVVPAEPPAAVIAYANSFDTKHTRAALGATTAADVGRSRGDHVRYSTVFKRAYLETTVLGASEGKAAGNHELSIACHRILPENFKLAERTSRGWRTMVTPMFFCKVCYRVTVGADGGRTITMTHIETDF